MKRFAFFLLMACGCTRDERLASMESWRQGAPKDLAAKVLAADPRLGDESYQTHCMACHGAWGAGDGAAGAALRPRPADLRREAASSSLEDIFLDVAQGKTATAMPAWGGVLQENEMIALVAKVKRFGRKP